jgi:DNA polymerase
MRRPVQPPVVSESPAEQLEALAEELRQSTFCPLKEKSIQTVPGQGHPQPDIAFIGEAPGQEEDQQGLAFVGPSGEILTRIITAMGLSRDEVWIGNIVKWRPPNNRAPTPEEVAGCMPYLCRQLDILKPKVIVSLGGVATKAMLDTTDGITKLRGQWKEFQGTPLMPTFHPSFLLRSQNRQQKEQYWKVWSDMESVLLKLGMPVPGKK